MNKSTWVIAAVALLTGIVSFWRGERMLAWYPLPLKGVVGRIVIAVVFAIVPAAIKRQGPVITWAVMNFCWGVGYGWVLPLVLRS